MSKLAHSDEKTMAELDRQRAAENGDEDLLEGVTPVASSTLSSHQQGTENG